MAKPNSSLPKYPRELKHLVEWARTLHRKDQLTYSELKAWSELLQISLQPWEVEALMYLDAIYHTRE